MRRYFIHLLRRDTWESITGMWCGVVFRVKRRDLPNQRLLLRTAHSDNSLLCLYSSETVERADSRSGNIGYRIRSHDLEAKLWGAFDRVKELIMSDQLLAHLSPHKETRMETDRRDRVHRRSVIAIARGRWRKT